MLYEELSALRVRQCSVNVWVLGLCARNAGVSMDILCIYRELGTALG